ncbi:Dyp-type peroxidase domain-containing protein [Streptomyces sp. NPDC047917]|uniref:Dyp-type peroxidase domain-containing protein n=1 Tax=Streptomyces sp. NPDC047917 TaxID=3365491 RepID=UPI00371F7378
MALDLAGGTSGWKAAEWKGALVRLRRLVAAVDGDGVDAWLGLGSGLFAGGERGPRLLKEMPSFAGDLLDPAQSHGDVLVQVAGDDEKAVREAAEQVVGRATGWRVRWQVDGFRAGNRVEGGKGLACNPFHFTEGFGNPGTDRETADRAVVRSGQGEPDWAVGGSYQVVRIVRLATELWDKDSVREQERIIGRRRDGRWGLLCHLRSYREPDEDECWTDHELWAASELLRAEQGFDGHDGEEPARRTRPGRRRRYPARVAAAGAVPPPGFRAPRRRPPCARVRLGCRSTSGRRGSSRPTAASARMPPGPRGSVVARPTNPPAPGSSCGRFV